MAARFVYDVYDNKTDSPLIVGGTICECARVLGITPDSFRDYVKKHRSKRYTVIKSLACEFDGSFAARLRVARFHAHFSQRELANKVGLAIPTLRDYESGERLPNVAIAAKLASVLGVSIKYLVGEQK